MNKQELIQLLHDRARGKHDRPIVKRDVEAFLDVLREVVVEHVLLRADKVSLPGLGQFHAAWLPKSRQQGGPRQLYAQFDWDKSVEKTLMEAKP